jgi:N-acetylmuramoyl-L-alanine amidase
LLPHNRSRIVVPALIVLAGSALALVAEVRTDAQTTSLYTVFTADGRRSLPVRSAGDDELVELDRVAELFGLTVSEDPRVEGITIVARDQRITLLPNQSFVSVGGRIDSLSAPVRRERGGYLVPLDFLSRAVGRALGQRIEIRRDSRVIVVGAVRVPRITPRFQRMGGRGRLDVAIDPATPHQVSREGNRLIIQFDAAALDVVRLTDGDAEFITATRVDDARLEIDLGPTVSSYRATTSPDDSRLSVELVPASPTSPVPAPIPLPGSVAPPVMDLSGPGVLKTVVIDPGHGGSDTGARGPGGTLEKTLTLQVATRLRSAIESRLGLRVLLTRESDMDVPVDRRSALANNNKADLFISLHANAAPVAAVTGAQVATLSLEAYRDRAGSGSGPGVALPVVGGGTRTIEAVPWDLAQLPYADRSTAVGYLLVRHLQARRVPMFGRPGQTVPLRGLVGANMPAVLLEMGFLSNGDDERALTGSERSDAIIDAIVAAIGDMRRRPVPDAGGGGR